MTALIGYCRDNEVVLGCDRLGSPWPPRSSAPITIDKMLRLAHDTAIVASLPLAMLDMLRTYLGRKPLGDEDLGAFRDRLTALLQQLHSDWVSQMRRWSDRHGLADVPPARCTLMLGSLDRQIPRLHVADSEANFAWAEVIENAAIAVPHEDLIALAVSVLERMPTYPTPADCIKAAIRAVSAADGRVSPHGRLIRMDAEGVKEETF